jgi:heterodisulfide reductase subunit A-like polyferredoxin
MKNYYYQKILKNPLILELLKTEKGKLNTKEGIIEIDNFSGNFNLNVLKNRLNIKNISQKNKQVLIQLF